MLPGNVTIVCNGRLWLNSSIPIVVSHLLALCTAGKSMIIHGHEHSQPELWFLCKIHANKVSGSPSTGRGG